MPDSEIILQGSFLNIFGVGTLITGEPGIGKSETALGLLDRQHQLIADDAPLFYKTQSIYGKNPLEKHFLSIRGIGLIEVAIMFGPGSIQHSHELNLIIHLDKNECKNPLAHLEGEQDTKDILGCLIPCVTIPIINPRNLEVLIETIVKTHLLKTNKCKLAITNFEEALRNKMESNLL